MKVESVRLQLTAFYAPPRDWDRSMQLAPDLHLEPGVIGGGNLNIIKRLSGESGGTRTHGLRGHNPAL